ncbi:rhamnulokinase [Actinobacteria bacterium YIM 96077]|uniref:Rhamnulokinase n=1 Tax=Phytoactinopolyspora halophila TaxID=1981511 RepID=A0A329R4J3_9ACTN|nr:rhamnulokinase family protein [Phytoactinopolyspora halophila]AYY11489.1 rhamnulokinase [Actinobacteria bacterium YIM 96077]RAW18028.1 rhamnulokinase [Phytoactinopolyspora halophila]
MTETLTAAAADLGGSSGRVMLGHIGPDHLDAELVHRFPNRPADRDGRLVWDVDTLLDGVVAGVAAARAADESLACVGIDSWAVDYGLLDSDGSLLGPPVHHRDSRTDGIMDTVRQRLGDGHLYGITGLQFLPFNTLYQLLAEEEDRLTRAATMLLMPDLVVHSLTGAVGAERTNASTTQLYDVVTGEWAVGLARELGLPVGIFPDIYDPGTPRGSLFPAIRERVGDDGRIQVGGVASHDTASAIVAVPAENRRFAYISCGTWSLVGVELDAPVLSDESATANFTNEVGVDGTIRYLRNVMGLWPLQECLRKWKAQGESARTINLGELVQAAAREPALRSVFDAESPELTPPGDMPARIRKLCADAGQPVPETRPALVRCILDSLALGHARTVRDAIRLSGHEVDVVHLVGGGSQNELLAQLTADATGLPVLAGPSEATALGNLLVQARTAGIIRTRTEGRALVRATQPITRFEPRSGIDWSGWLD